MTGMGQTELHAYVIRGFHFKLEVVHVEWHVQCAATILMLLLLGAVRDDSSLDAAASNV
jgi:hypothetical protein